MSTMRIRPGTDIEVELCGEVPEEAAARVCDKIMPLVRYQRQPVLGVWVKLTRCRDTSAVRPALAEATVDLNGWQVRAQAAAVSVPAAIDLLGERLAGRLARLADRGEALRPTSFATPRKPLDEVVCDKERADQGFHLFTDADSGGDCVVHHPEPTGC